MNLLNYFATSICKYALQEVLKLFAQVNISKLLQVQTSHLYLLNKKTNISHNLTNLTKPKTENLDYVHIYLLVYGKTYLHLSIESSRMHDMVKLKKNNHG